ncbi:MAG: hypothetical protein CVV50_05040 [Spirochaetae bacterium HGW-Spirochaetae-6]|nr:MAG: hypothetical protein CVV50_05040 [Spirochaetae bacterium HGW-Spirochaetae-6]
MNKILKRALLLMVCLLGTMMGSHLLQGKKDIDFKLEVPERSAETGESEAIYEETERWGAEPEPQEAEWFYLDSTFYVPSPFPRDDDEPEPPAEDQDIRKSIRKLKDIAVSYFEKKATYATINGAKVRIDNDCSQFVRSVYWKAFGKDLFKESVELGNRTSSGTELLYYYLKSQARILKKNQIPVVGDIIFFNNTYDRNRNNRFDDPLTHVGIVTAADKSGQIEFLHANVGRPKAIYQAYLNVKAPGDFRQGDKVLNSYLQVRYRWDGRSRNSTAAELVHSFGGIK